MPKMMKIKLVKSPAGQIPKHRDTVRGLGFRKLYQERLIVDNPQTRGMVKEVCYMVKILETDVNA